MRGRPSTVIGDRGPLTTQNPSTRSFPAQDPKIGSFVKYGSLRALVKMFTIILISDM